MQAAAARALSFGAPTEAEVELAEALCRLVPRCEMVRLVSSGTEATMTAIRLARGHTGRSLIVKFEGCYHGHADSLLVKAGSGALTFGNPSSAGVPPETAAHTLVLDYNDTAQVEKLFNEKGNADRLRDRRAGRRQHEPGPAQARVSSNRLRENCSQHGAVLIFDEVMTGFRVALGGAQARYGIRPDLTTLGKVIGGGLPVGAFGGRRDIMQKIAPLGPVYQAGTLSGNPVAVAAGLATLKLVEAKDFQSKIEATTQSLVEGLIAEAQEGERRVLGAIHRQHVRPVLPRRAARQLRRSHAVRQGPLQQILPRACSRAACTSRPRPTKQDSFPRRMARRRSMPRSPPRANRSARYSRNSVARPRKMKKPPESVQAVMRTDEPTAGSWPKRARR